MEFTFDRFYKQNRKFVIWAILFGLIWYLRENFTLIFLTFIIGFFALPLAEFMMRRLRLSRGFSIILVYLTIFAGNIALYVMILPSAISQATLLQKNLPAIQSKMNETRDLYILKYPNVASLLKFYPEPYNLREGDIPSAASFYARLAEQSQLTSPNPGRRIVELLPEDVSDGIIQAAEAFKKDPNDYIHDAKLEKDLLDAFNSERLLKKRDFYRDWDFGEVDRADERLKALLMRNRQDLGEQEVQKMNRLLIEAAYPQFVVPTPEAEDKVEAFIDKYRSQLEARIPEFGLYLWRFFITSQLAILFSFLIVWDYARLKNDIKNLASSKLKDFFEEAGQPVVRFAMSVGRGFQAVAIIALITTLMMLVPLFALRVPSVALLALVTFVTSLFPIIGVIPEMAALVLVTLNEHGIERAGIIFGAAVVIHFIVSYFVGPYVFGREFKINPVAVIFILYVGNKVGGLWGMMLGVPVTVYILRDILKVPLLDEKGPMSLLQKQRAKMKARHMRRMREQRRLEKLVQESEIEPAAPVAATENLPERKLPA